jgi:hypothetical protein
MEPSMIQYSLFDAPTRIARRTDKETSHDAAAETDVKLGKLQSACLDVMRVSRTPMTATEVAETAAHNRGGMQESYRKRLRELVRIGAAVECEPRECSITGKRATTYKAKESA